MCEEDRDSPDIATGEDRGAAASLSECCLYGLCLLRAEEVPIAVLRQREAKWLEMLNSWDKWMAKKHNKVRCVNRTS